jgi:Tol biopolymer transport system component
MTGEERTMTAPFAGAFARTLQWFPDSRSVLVTDTVARRKRFRQINVESGDAQVLFEGPWEVWGGAALSADGKALFYSIREQSAAPGMATLHLMKRRLETGEEAELYRAKSSGSAFYGLTVSSDGSQLAFFGNSADDKGALMVMPTDGGTPHEIYRAPVSLLGAMGQGAMSWTRDGHHLVVTARCGPGEGQYLCAISREGGELKPLGRSMSEIPSRMISADGRRIAFTAKTFKEELWVIRNLLSEPAKAP